MKENIKFWLVSFIIISTIFVVETFYPLGSKISGIFGEGLMRLSGRLLLLLWFISLVIILYKLFYKYFRDL